MLLNHSGTHLSCTPDSYKFLSQTRIKELPPHPPKQTKQQQQRLSLAMLHKIHNHFLFVLLNFHCVIYSWQEHLDTCRALFRSWLRRAQCPYSSCCTMVWEHPWAVQIPEVQTIMRHHAVKPMHISVCFYWMSRRKKFLFHVCDHFLLWLDIQFLPLSFLLKT